MPLKRFSRFFINYGYTVIETAAPDTDLFDNFGGFGGLGGLGGLGGFGNSRLFSPFFGAFGKFNQSRITPTYVLNTVDNPMFPYKGRRYTASFAFAGGPLGGTVDYYKPTFEGIFYLPVPRRTNFGFRALVSWLQGFGGGESSSGTIDGVPVFERFFMGGEKPGPRVRHPLTGAAARQRRRGHRFGRRYQDDAVQHGVLYSAGGAPASSVILLTPVRRTQTKPR